MAHRLTRRGFLHGAATAGAALSLPRSRAFGANEEIQVAIIGCGTMGSGHAGGFHGLPGARVAAVSDADLERMAAAANGLQPTPQQHQDFRRILDDPGIDAVVIATPNHWHAAMTIMACQAGKHVYVQKPVSHSIWEGRQMVRAARKYDRIVQAGTQHRSDLALVEVGEDIRSGKYGPLQWVHTLVLHTRESIGKVSQPQPVPDSIDYDLWCGPATKTPVMRKSFHYDWHWQWNWGDGETGNWGPHYVDDVRNVLGWDDVPTSVVAAGGRFAWSDDGETPNIHLTLMERQGVPVVVDIRNLPRGGGSTEPAEHLGLVHGNVFMCEGAAVKIQRGGGAAYDHDGNHIKQYRGNGGSHEANFIQAIRSGSRAELKAEIEVGHLSTVMCHMANIAYRVGSQATVDEVRQSMADNEEAARTLSAVVNQLDANQVDVAQFPLTLGPALEFDPKSEQFMGPGAAGANRLLRNVMRKEYAIPEVV